MTALAMVLTLGPAERFASGKQVGSYFGLIPSEYSSGGQQRLGHISKQGSSFMRFLLVEAGQSAVRYDAELGRFYRRLAVRKHRALAKVAVARKLATRLYLMLREDWNYAQLCRAVVQVSPSHSVVARLDRPLEWAACLPEQRGVRSTNHGSTNRRDGWWDPASPARLKEQRLGLDIKTLSARAKWRCLERRAGGEVLPKKLDRHSRR